ncbi:MAG: GxxExxY protein [Opitutae bacterium]|nr:GxxExxY protein [Opitutae bacterium]
MDVNQTEVLVFKIVGAAMTVHNTIGHGLREKTYERALVVEFQHLGISYDQQHRYPVPYRNVKVDEYIPDLEVEDLIVVDTKVVTQIHDDDIGQIINYLKITGKNTGLILNFKHPKLEWRKVTYNPSSPS